MRFSYSTKRPYERFSKHISLYYVDFDRLGSLRVPNDFEKDLQERLIHNDVDFVDLKRLLEALEPRERKLVEAYYMGYSQSEIADQLGIAQQSVSRLLHRVGYRLYRMVKGLPWRGGAAGLPMPENGGGSAD